MSWSRSPATSASTGNIPQIIELVAPRYDAKRHGPATGINLVQAYLAVRDADAAQHVLDILFALKRRSSRTACTVFPTRSPS